MYLNDNSFSINKDTGKSARAKYLAGNEYGEEQKSLLVISEPYKEEIINMFGDSSEQEFVDVIYNGKVYRVLNCLSEVPRLDYF